MPPLIWDKAGDRRFETGLDRGVLYLPNGEAVPWNGLLSVDENSNRSTETIYFDGMAISDLETIGNFRASLSAITYPDELSELDGSAYLQPGVLATQQKARRFGLSYRTKVGNDSNPDAGYKIHLLYNVLAIPSSKSYATIGDDPEALEFEWDISTIPLDVPGMRPTSHFIIESSGIDPWLLEDLEAALYGDDASSATLMPLDEMISFLSGWYRVRIIDHGDGSWTAEEARPGFISEVTSGPSEGLFEIINVNAIYLDDVTYELSDTTTDMTHPPIDIVDNGNGTWTAVTDAEGVITVDGDGLFTIVDIETVFQGPEIYRIQEHKR